MDSEERDVLLAEIRRIDQILTEREKQVNLAMAASQRAIEKAESEGLRAREAANEWRGAMSDRERLYTSQVAHNLLQSEVDYLRKSIDTSTGRRGAWIAAAGVIATLLAIGVGQILRQNLTSSDVSNQIQREAPWNRDKGQVERRISLLEAQIQRQQLEIQKLQQRDAFFCQTRSPLLPGC